MKDYEDEAFDDLERAQGWRKRQIVDKQEQDMPKIGCVNHDCDKCKEQEQGEPVAVKRMREWIVALKSRSDNGEHMTIDSGISAGTCWELAIELEQFINTTPQQRTWVGLTDADMTECIVQTCNTDDGTGDTRDLIRAVEAKLKAKNGP